MAQYCDVCDDGKNMGECVHGSCPGLGWESTPAEEAYALLANAARLAVARMDARKNENITEWARKLADDMVAAGEKEYGV